MASSTIAMSAYNVIALGRVPVPAVVLRALLPERPTLEALGAALQEMRLRGWVRCGSAGWDVCDAKRRIVRSRDLRDAAVVGGDVRGGWTGWLVQCRQLGMLSIDDAVAESRAAEAVQA